MAKKKFWIGSVGPLIYDDVNTYGDAVTHKGFRTEGIVQVDGAPASPSHVVRLTDLNSAVATLAPKDATYVTISANTVLTDERTLAVGNSLTKTDGGAGSTVTLDTVQDIRTIASPEFVNVNATGEYRVDGVKVVGNQQGAVTSLTDSTGGTANDTLVDVTTVAVADPVKVNDNFADVAAKINAIFGILRAHGLQAT